MAPSLTVITIIVNITVGKIFGFATSKFYPDFTRLASPCDKRGWLPASIHVALSMQKSETKIEMVPRAAGWISQSETCWITLSQMGN